MTQSLSGAEFNSIQTPASCFPAELWVYCVMCGIYQLNLETLIR